AGGVGETPWPRAVPRLVGWARGPDRRRARLERRPLPCPSLHGSGIGQDPVVRNPPAGADSVAKDLGVMNIAGALPFSIGPAIAPMVLAAGGGSYAFLCAGAGACALASAGVIQRVRQVRWGAVGGAE